MALNPKKRRKSWLAQYFNQLVKIPTPWLEFASAYSWVNLLVRSFTKALDKREVEEKNSIDGEDDADSPEGDEEEGSLNLELTLPTCKCYAIWPQGNA